MAVDISGCEPCIAQIRAFADGIFAINNSGEVFDDHRRENVAQLALMIQITVGEIARKLEFEEE